MFQVGNYRQPSQECQWNPNEVLVNEWPAEEGQERPEIEELWRVDLGYMVGFISKNNASVDDDESSEGYHKADEGL